MRGLTPAEYAELQVIARPNAGCIYFDGDATEDVLHNLVLQGRAVECEEMADDGLTDQVWRITEQGRLALRIYLRIQGPLP